MRSSLMDVVGKGSCSNCGATFDKNTDACPVCGMPFGESGAELPVRPRPKPEPDAARRHALEAGDAPAKRGSLIVVTAVAVVVLAIVGVAVVASSGAGEPQTAPPVDETVVGEDAPQPVVVEPTPAPEVKPSASFTFHRKRESHAGTFYVLGEVENTSPFAIRKPELVIVLLDEEGNEVATDSGFALAEILEPGEKSYLSAVVTSPPEHHELKFEVVPRKATYRPKLAEGLTVDAIQPQVKDSGLYKFGGSVKNGGATTAKFVSVQVLAFDAEEKLMGVYSTYAKTDALAPGDKARFTATGVGLETAPARFEYLVSARVAD